MVLCRQVAPEPSHTQIDSKIQECVTTGGTKAYFSATVNDKGQVELDIGNVLPVQPW